MNEVGPLFYWGFLALLFAAMYASVRFGIIIGRDQEYVRRSSRLILALKKIRDWTAPDDGPRTTHESIHYLADTTVKKFEVSTNDAGL